VLSAATASVKFGSVRKKPYTQSNQRCLCGIHSNRKAVFTTSVKWHIIWHQLEYMVVTCMFTMSR